MVQQTITASGKVSVTDEAFAEICMQNYWDKWTKNKKPKWTDARAGHTLFKGWDPQAYLQFNIICKRITNERETHQSQILEDTFLAYALETFGVTGGRRRRPNKQKAAEEDDEEECYNELEEV